MFCTAQVQPPREPAPGAGGTPEEANGDAAHAPGARGGDVRISVGADASPPAPPTPDVRAPRPAALALLRLSVKQPRCASPSGPRTPQHEAVWGRSNSEHTCSAIRAGGAGQGPASVQPHQPAPCPC